VLVLDLWLNALRRGELAKPTTNEALLAQAV
jgi:hypothetical protein